MLLLPVLSVRGLLQWSEGCIRSRPRSSVLTDSSLYPLLSLPQRPPFRFQESRRAPGGQVIADAHLICCELLGICYSTSEYCRLSRLSCFAEAQLGKNGKNIGIGGGCDVPRVPCTDDSREQTIRRSRGGREHGESGWRIGRPINSQSNNNSNLPFFRRWCFVAPPILLADATTDSWLLSFFDAAAAFLFFLAPNERSRLAFRRWAPDVIHFVMVSHCCAGRAARYLFVHGFTGASLRLFEGRRLFFGLVRFSQIFNFNRTHCQPKIEWPLLFSKSFIGRTMKRSVIF